MSSVEKKKRNVVVKSAKLFYYNGYVNTGINEILKECNIPKGSFYYYFKNKEDLLFYVIDLHTDNLINYFNKIVDDLSIYKLKTFFNNFFHHIQKNKFHGGSPLGNLVLELSDINENIREKLSQSYNKIEQRVEFFLELLSTTNKKYSHIEPRTYSNILISAFEGTLLKVKLEKNDNPIDDFLIFFDILVSNQNNNEK